MRTCHLGLSATGLLLLLVLTVNAPVWGADDLVGTIQKTYENLTAFDAKFTQVLRNTASGEEQERKGMIFFKNPGLVRWETTEPESELLVVGKSVVWDYFDEEKVAYKYSVEQVLDSKTMLRFISGQARLDQDFWISREGDEEGLAKLNLTPKEPEPQLVQAYVWVEAGQGLLRRILLQDFYGNENELHFTELRINPDAPDDLFEFTPPADAEIFDNMPPAGVQEQTLTQ